MAQWRKVIVSGSDAELNTLQVGGGAGDTGVTISAIGALTVDGATDLNSTLNVDGTITGNTSLTLDTTTISTAEIGVLDSVTPGTAAASKALVLDASKDIGTIRNLTIDGTLSDGNYTFDTSGNVTGLGTIGSGNITSTGTVQGTVITATTGFAPDAQDGAYLGTSALQFSDLFLADAAVIAFGDDGEVTLTHVHNTGLLLSDDSGIGTTKLMFGDTATYINQSTDGQLDLVADTEIQIAATTIDINGAVAFDGALTGITNITLSGTLSDGNYTFDTDGNVSGLGTLGCGAITTSGHLDANSTANIEGLVTVQTGIVPDASDGAYLGTSSLEFSDLFLADAAVISLGDGGSDVTLTHVADTGILLNSTNRIQFNDSTQYIGASDAANLDIGATTDVNIEATTLDVNAILDVSGNSTFGGTITAASIGADTDNSVVILNGSGLLKTDEIDSRVWGSTLVDTDGSGANNELATWSDSDSIIGEGNLTFDGSTLVVTGNQTISGDLTVSGDTTTLSTTNLAVEDAFIFSAKGSAGTNVDAGLIVQSGSAVDSGSAIYHDINSERWAVAKGVGSIATAVTPKQMVVTTTLSSATPGSSDGDYGVGEMWLETDSQDIWIRTA
jgi:hypothetical protein